MKKDFLILSSVVLLMGATSCTDEIIVQSVENSDPVTLTFTASQEELSYQSSTRSLIREGESVYWVANDRISVFAGDGSAYNYPFITKDGGVVTDFQGDVNNTPESYYYALYPYNPTASINGRIISTVLHSHQYLEPNSYASGMNISVSRSSNKDAQDLAFLNSTACLKVIIDKNYQGDKIYSMRLRGNDNENIAGDITIEVIPSNPSAVVVQNDNAVQTIYLDRINPDDYAMPGLSYYFVLAPTNMPNGFTLTLVNENGQTCEKVFDEAYNFIRSKVETVTISEATFSGDECGEYTGDGLYIANSARCLRTWANLAKDDLALGCYITADIDLNDDSNEEWPSIGTVEAPFTGKIVGNGHTIKNLNITGNKQYAGFVGALGAEGSIENIIFEDPTVSSSYEGDVGDASDDGFVGVVVGLLNKEVANNHTKASIVNCTVKNPTVSGAENVGGIAGRSYGRGDVINKCTVVGGQLTGQMFVGGIIGNAEGVIEDCHVEEGTKVSYDNMQSEARVGGVVGTNNTGQLVACTANAEIHGENNDTYHARYCGGIAGANNGTMVGCAFTGTVSGDYGGALAGESYGDIYGCYANNATAKALIYKVKRNLNYEFGDENQTDVVFPTFNGCYWVGASGSLFGEEESYVEEHATITNSTVVTSLSNAETSNMNAALTTVNNDSEYAYGSGYQYTNNTGDDSTNLPVKATVEQQVQ